MTPGKKRGHSHFLVWRLRRSSKCTAMPRTARASQGGFCYHVLNRGNGGRAVFRKDGGYRAFVRAILLRRADDGPWSGVGDVVGVAAKAGVADKT